MRVGVIGEQARQPVPGGIGTYLFALLDGLVELDDPDLEIVALASRPHGHDPLADHGVAVRTTRATHRVQMALWDRGLGRPSIDLDVMHLTSLAGPIAKTNAPPRTVMVHDLSWRHFPELTTSRGVRWHEAALKRVVASDALILTTSSNVAEEVAAAGVSRDRITVVHAGSDHLKVQNVPGARALLDSFGVTGQFFLTVSTLEPRKNLPGLISAYSRAMPEFLEPCPLVIVGPTGWGPTLKPAKGVVFAGHQSDEVLAALYGLATCFVYVPIHEGFGIPPLEAMAQGTPVIVSRETPSTQRTDACWKVDASDADGLASRLLDSLRDEATSRAIGASGKEFADGYRWIDVARAHRDVWRTIS
jgi:glycosyltransferase involved in cell wall biosynthesis